MKTVFFTNLLHSKAKSTLCPRYLVKSKFYFVCALWNTFSAGATRVGVAADADISPLYVAVRSIAYGGAVSTSPVVVESHAERASVAPNRQNVATVFFIFFPRLVIV